MEQWAHACNRKQRLQEASLFLWKRKGIYCVTSLNTRASWSCRCCAIPFFTLGCVSFRNDEAADAKPWGPPCAICTQLSQWLWTSACERRAHQPKHALEGLAHTRSMGRVRKEPGKQGERGGAPRSFFFRKGAIMGRSVAQAPHDDRAPSFNVLFVQRQHRRALMSKPF